MKSRRQPSLDRRRAAQLAAALAARRPGYLAPWQPQPGSPGQALIEVWARYYEALLGRLEQAPGKNRLAFLDLAGIDRIAATEARAPVVFQLAEGSAAQSLPAGTKLAAAPAPPPVRGDDPQAAQAAAGQVVFETERALGLMPGKLVQVVSLWPGRDEYVDHSAAAAAGEPFTLFDPALLEKTPHHLYLAHPVLLALAGTVELQVALELAQGGSEQLTIEWEYWDGSVWRPFAELAGAGGPCPADPAAAAAADGTEGLTVSGSVVLTSACAEAAKLEIDGHESFWLRGRLDEPLPVDRRQLLPELSSVRLTAVHRRERRVAIAGFATEYQPPEEGEGAQIVLTANNSDGGPAQGARFTLRKGGIPIGYRYYGTSPATFDLGDEVPAEPVDLEFEIELLDSTLVKRFRFQPPSVALGSLAITLTVEIEALVPEKAFADADKLDMTKPFYPLGQSPRPGSVFYFAAPEPLSKPGARLTVHMERADTPQEQMAVGAGGGGGGGGVLVSEELVELGEAIDLGGGGGGGGTGSKHTVSWEYHDGRRWRSLKSFTGSTPTTPSAGKPDDLSGDGAVELLMPDDAAPVEVHGTEELWLRVRLLEGTYAVRQEISWDDGNGNTNTFAYLIPRPPAIKLFQLSYIWEQGPEPAEKVLTYNDFRYGDRTDAARWPEQPFRPFEQVSDLTPALYLGFDQPFPLDRLSVYFDIAEEPGVDRPALSWERHEGGSWLSLSVEDGTDDLAQPGALSFLGSGEAAADPLARFGTPSSDSGLSNGELPDGELPDGELHWLRARRAADGPPPEAAVTAIHPNAAWVAQRETVGDETVGTARGIAHESFRLRRNPVLTGERVEVEELSGPRAAVEWRRLALELLADDSAAGNGSGNGNGNANGNGAGRGEEVLRRLEERLGAEGRELDIEEGDLRLRRNPAKEVSEVWVRWRPVRRLVECPAGERCYAIDRAAGRITFGDSAHGRVPPAGARVLARRYVSGGGRAGNVDAGEIKQLLTGLAGVEKVYNPVPAEGGADAEIMAAAARRGPRTLAHRGRGLAAGDLETMALEASPAVAVARALPTTDASRRPVKKGRGRPGWVTLVIIPASEAPRPYPSPGLRERVRRYLAERCEAGIAAADRVVVTGPRYYPVGVEATLLPRDPAAAGAVAAAVRRALERFLHPLSGGEGGGGWQPGRSVYLSDVAAVLERVEGVDSVERLALTVDGVPRGESVPVPPDGTVAAGTLRLTMKRATSSGREA